MRLRLILRLRLPWRGPVNLPTGCLAKQVPRRLRLRLQSVRVRGVVLRLLLRLRLRLLLRLRMRLVLRLRLLLRLRLILRLRLRLRSRLLQTYAKTS